MMQTEWVKLIDRCTPAQRADVLVKLTDQQLYDLVFSDDALTWPHREMWASISRHLAMRLIYPSCRIASPPQQEEPIQWDSTTTR
jgi:hypothetical protein